MRAAKLGLMPVLQPLFLYTGDRSYLPSEVQVNVYGFAYTVLGNRFVFVNFTECEYRSIQVRCGKIYWRPFIFTKRSAGKNVYGSVYIASGNNPALVNFSEREYRGNPRII